MTGDVADYREVGDSLEIGVSTGERRRRARLVRPRRRDHRRGPRGAVRRRLRGARARRSRTCCCRRRVLLACTSPSCRRCARSSRRRARCRTGRRPRCGSAASRPACGRSWPSSASSTRQAAGVAAAGRRRCSRSTQLDAVTESPADARARELRPYQRDGFHWLAFLWQHRARRHPRRRHGARQDAADARADLPRPGARTRAAARSSSSRRRASCPNWAAEAARFAPDLRGGDGHRHARAGAARTWPRSSRAPTSSSPRTRCSGSTSTPTAPAGGPGWSSTRRSSSRTTSPRPTSARAGCRRRSSSRSPARRWRTT